MLRPFHLQMPAKTLLHRHPIRRHKRPFLLRRLCSFLQVLSPRPRLLLRSGEANKRIRRLQWRTVQLPGLPLLLSPGMVLTKDGVKADQVRVLDRQMLRLHNLAGYEGILSICFSYSTLRIFVLTGCLLYYFTFLPYFNMTLLTLLRTQVSKNQSTETFITYYTNFKIICRE